MTFLQLHTECDELLCRIGDLGVSLTGHSEGSDSLQHVTAFWNNHSDLVQRHRASSCNVAVLGLAKSGMRKHHVPRCLLTQVPVPRLDMGPVQADSDLSDLAGKSTVLNALIGSRVLPTSNVPETARITRLRHDKQCSEPVLASSGGRQPIAGADAVHAHLELLNRQVSAHRPNAVSGSVPSDI